MLFSIWSRLIPYTPRSSSRNRVISQPKCAWFMFAFSKAHFTYRSVFLCLWRRARSRKQAIWHCRLASVCVGTVPLSVFLLPLEGSREKANAVSVWSTAHSCPLRGHRRHQDTDDFPSPLVLLTKARFDPYAFFHIMSNSWRVQNKGEKPHNGILLPVFLPSKVVCWILDILPALSMWGVPFFFRRGFVHFPMSVFLCAPHSAFLSIIPHWVSTEK